MLVLAEEQQQRVACPPRTCGNLNISHPFWVLDKETGRSCGGPGRPDFLVNCNNNTPVLRSTGSFGFRIVNITYEERSLRLIDLGKLNLLQASNSCESSWNTSVKLGRPFHISNTNRNLILYNCTEPPAAARRDKELVETRMKCGNQSEVFASVGGSYDEASDYGGYAVEGCHACVVPVLRSSGEANASQYKRLINSGFFLTWDDPPPPRPPLAGQFAHTSKSSLYWLLPCSFSRLLRNTIQVATDNRFSEIRKILLKMSPGIFQINIYI
jgi:hypothetical protein